MDNPATLPGQSLGIAALGIRRDQSTQRLLWSGQVTRTLPTRSANSNVELHVTEAGLDLVFPCRGRDGSLEVFLVHPGGPFCTQNCQIT